MVGVTSSTGVVYVSGQPAYDHLQTNYFLDRLPNARNDSTVLLAKINKRPHIPVSGRFIVFPVTYGRNTGVGNVGYGGVIPAPGKQLAATFSTISRKGMARIAVDRDTIKHVKTGGGGYVDPVALEMQRALVDVAIDRARQVHNDGSGRIAEVDTISGATASLTVKVNSSIEGASVTRASGTLDVYFEVGMRVAFISSAGSIGTPYTSQQYAYVCTVSVSGVTVTLSFSKTADRAVAGSTDNFNTNPTSGDWIVRQHEEITSGALTKDTAFKREIMGIGGIFSDIGVLDGVTASGSQQSGSYDDTSTATTWFQGIVCSTNTFNQGIVADNSGNGVRPVTEALLQSTLTEAERINNAEVELMLMHNYVYDSLVALGIVDKRYVNTDVLALGHGTLKFNGLAAVKDRFCYQNRVYFLGLSEIEILETQAVEPVVIGDTTTWERVSTTTRGDLDQAWRAWGWDDQLCVTGVRNRCGAVLTELSI